MIRIDVRMSVSKEELNISGGESLLIGVIEKWEAYLNERVGSCKRVYLNIPKACCILGYENCSSWNSEIRNQGQDDGEVVCGWR